MRLALYQPEIPQNTGTLIRLGACMGVGIDVVEPCGYIWDDARLKRAGMDYMELANVTRHSSWQAFYQNIKPARLIILDTKAEIDYLDFEFQSDDILMVGRESDGVPENVFKTADSQLRISMLSDRRSLNVAIAASIVLGEALRQTRKEDRMTTLEQKQALSKWFTDLQKRICIALEEIEQDFQHQTILPGHFEFKPWQREAGEGGGGTMGLMFGAVFEKAGVNVSTVYGEFSPEFQAHIPGAANDPRFWASGLSLVIHPMNPYVPAVHMNTRHIVTTRSWFGGGSDLTPTFEFSQDTKDFHQAFKEACDQHDLSDYPRFKQWCDEYFYLPHRDEARGVGGIFYDNIDTENFDHDFAFTKAVGEAFLKIYPQLVRRRMHTPWTDEDKHKQYVKRGRYVEFNLMYDRGTLFGLKTGGNIEAILMSLPPMASWP